MAEQTSPVEVTNTGPAPAAGRSVGQLRERWDQLFDALLADFPRWPSLRRPFDIEPLRPLTGGDLILAVDSKEQDQACLITAERPAWRTRTSASRYATICSSCTATSAPSARERMRGLPPYRAQLRQLHAQLPRAACRLMPTPAGRTPASPGVC